VSATEVPRHRRRIYLRGAKLLEDPSFVVEDSIEEQTSPDNLRITLTCEFSVSLSRETVGLR
jgi:hypothetical protein